MRTKDLLVQILHRIDLIDRALIVRDPGTARSVEAYEGLRKQVAASGRARIQHVAHLGQLYDAIEQGADVDQLRAKVLEFMEQAGLDLAESFPRADAFAVLEGEGPEIEILTPAVVDRHTGQIVRQGTARGISNTAPDPSQGALPKTGDEQTAPAPNSDPVEVGTDPEPNPEGKAT